MLTDGYINKLTGFLRLLTLNMDGVCQLAVNGVASVLDGDHTTAFPPGDHRDRLAAVTAEREQERIQFLVSEIKFD